MTRMTKIVFASFPLLAVLGSFVGALVPWFEYQVSWDPPRVSWDWGHLESESDLTTERLWPFERGPDVYPALSQGLQGCYIAGMCGTCTTPGFPNRLHVSRLTAPEVHSVRLLRLLGIAAPAVSLVVFGVMLVWLTIRYFSRYRSRSFLVLVAVPVAVLLVFLCGIVVLALFGPVIGDRLFWESLPGWESCRTTLPTIECQRFQGEPYILSVGSDVARWEFSRVLPLGPALAGGSLVLAPVAIALCLHSRKTTRQLADSPTRST